MAGSFNFKSLASRLDQIHLTLSTSIYPKSTSFTQKSVSNFNKDIVRYIHQTDSCSYAVTIKGSKLSIFRNHEISLKISFKTGFPIIVQSKTPINHPCVSVDLVVYIHPKTSHDLSAIIDQVYQNLSVEVPTHSYGILNYDVLKDFKADNVAWKCNQERLLDVHFKENCIVVD